MDINEIIFGKTTAYIDEDTEELLLSELIKSWPLIIKLIDSFYKPFSFIIFTTDSSYRQTFKRSNFFYLKADPWIAKFISLFSLYIVIKHIFIDYSSYHFGYYSNYWNPQVRKGSPRTSECAFKDDIEEKNDSIRGNIIYYKNYLDFLGVPISFIDSGFILMCNLFVVGMIMNYWFIYSRRNCRIHNNTMSFLKEPVLERKRLQGELIQIIKDLEKDSLARSLVDCSCKLKRLQKYKTLTQIIQDNISDLLKPPANVGHRCFKGLVMTISSFTIILAFINSFCYYFAFYSWFKSEKSSIDQELSLLAGCKLWNQNATPIRDPCLLYDFRSTFIENNTNFTKEPDIYSILDSIYLIITKYKSYDLNVLIYLIECFILIQIGFYFTKEYIINRDSNVHSIKLWLRQIDDQLRSCQTILRSIHRISSLEHSDKIKIDIKINEGLKELDKALLIAYVNLELLYRERHNHMGLIDTITNQFLLQNLSVLIAGYSCSIYSKSNLSAIVFSILSLAFFNYDCNLSISVTESARRTFNLLNDVIAQVSISDISKLSAYNLIKRHLTMDEEVQELYAIRFICMRLTRGSVISINSYAIGGFLYMIQAYSMISYKQNN